MVSVKTKFRASTVNGKKGSLYYQVIHNRIVRRVKTDYKIFASEWDAHNETVTSDTCRSDDRRYSVVRSIQESIRWDKLRLGKIIQALEHQGVGYTADDIVTQFYNKAKEQSFFNFMNGVISQLNMLGRVRTSETYRATLKSFASFRKERDVMLEDISSDMMLLYEAWLKRREVSLNTISFYMRILRATYNRAVEKKLTLQCFPFKHVYTGVEKTAKRAISFKYLKKIKELKLTAGSSLDFSRDMFLFSFYTRGMSFVDMAYLKKKDLQNGVLTYRRRKTGQRLFIRWESCMQEVVNKYGDTGTEYLFPIILQQEKGRKQYENALHLINSKLKELSVMLGLPIRLTMYVARHSWANAAKTKNIPIAVISEGMGHDSEGTTRIYLASLDCDVIDKANKLILKNL